MEKLIEFISSFKDLNWKEIVFRDLNLLPFLVSALILVLFLKWLINAKSKRRPSLGISSLALFEKERFSRKTARKLPEALFIAGIMFVILVRLNPVLPLLKNKKKIEAKEIMIILDCSESMTHKWKEYTAEESEETRWDLERRHVIKFIEERAKASQKNDLIGLIVYSKNAYLTCSLTSDYQNLISLIKLFRIREGEMGSWKNIIPDEIHTATGEALFLVDKYFKKYGKTKAKEELIVLFTDGVNNEGRDPEEALEEIKKSGFKICLLRVDFRSGAENLVEAVKEIGGADFSINTEEDFGKAINFIDKWTGKSRMIIDEYIVDQLQYFYFGFIALVLFMLALFLKHLHYFRDLL